MSYHIKPITKGKYGTFSKLKEEMEEIEDALEQENPIMVLVELSDLVGAIEGYANSMGFTLGDITRMSEATKRAFRSGGRSSEN